MSTLYWQSADWAPQTLSLCHAHIVARGGPGQGAQPQPLAPPGTPEPIVRKMNQEMNKIALDPELRERSFGVALTPYAGSPEELTALLKNDYERYGKLVRQLNLRAE